MLYCIIVHVVVVLTSFSPTLFYFSVNKRYIGDSFSTVLQLPHVLVLFSMYSTLNGLLCFMWVGYWRGVEVRPFFFIYFG